MFRRIFPFLAVLLFVVADTSVVPMAAQGWLYPLFGYTAVLTFGLLLGRTRGALYGIIAGLLVDVTSSIPFGLMTVLYAVGGFASGFAGRKLRRNVLSTVLAPLACLLVFEAGMLCYAAIAGMDFAPVLLYRAGARILVNVVLVQLEYLLFDLVCRPKTSRYETR
ncbi:MAG: rod shape-determining protein MreD [Eubacteriales bacterium]|nr:rod shape-determining protein MreD [Eubacteriales bacterium]